MYKVPIHTKALTFKEAEEHLTIQLRVGIDPVLETVEEMLSVLKNPQDSYKVIQIGGTNGKTSTSRYAAAFLREKGQKVGLFTSPELTSVTERIEINGQPVSKELFAKGISAAVAAGEKVNHKRLEDGQDLYNITEFDLLTVAALVIFAMEEVQVAVLEVGMGGRWDATSATNPVITAITGVDIDHTDVLGKTKLEIAQEKAAIIKSGQKVFLGEGIVEDKDVSGVIQARCDAVDLTPHEIIEKPNFDVPDYVPTYQLPNIALAREIAQCYLEEKISDLDAKKVVEELQIPGRFEKVSVEPLQIIDAAHNVQSVQKTMQELKALQQKTNKPIDLLVAMFADKDTEGMVQAIIANINPASQIYVTQTGHKRSLNAEKLAELFKDAGHPATEVYKTVDGALKALEKKDFLALGTITLAGEVKGFFNKKQNK